MKLNLLSFSLILITLTISLANRLFLKQNTLLSDKVPVESLDKKTDKVESATLKSSSFRNFKRLFRIKEEALRSNPLDNSDTDDCPAELMVSDWDRFKQNFPLKTQACTALWKSNDGMPGKKIVDEFALIDKNFTKESCPTREEYDDMSKTNQKLLSLTEKLMPNTFKQCMDLWNSQKKSRKEGNTGQNTIKMNNNGCLKERHEAFSRLLNSEKANPLDNSKNDDCPAKFMVESILSVYKEQMPLKTKACEELWKTNNGYPGKKFVEMYTEMDKQREECPTKKEIDLATKGYYQNLEILKAIMPKSFANCKGLRVSSPYRIEKESVSEGVGVIESLKIAKPFDNSKTNDCPAQFLVRQFWETYKDLLPLKYKACNAFWSHNGGKPGPIFTTQYQEYEKTVKECPNVEKVEKLIEGNKKYLDILKELMPKTFERCKDLQSIKAI